MMYETIYLITFVQCTIHWLQVTHIKGVENEEIMGGKPWKWKV